MVGGPSVVIETKGVVNGPPIRDSTNWCKTIVRIDANQLCPHSMCQTIPTGLYSRWELDSESGKVKGRQNNSKKLENFV